jgi:hypothetical protein
MRTSTRPYKHIKIDTNAFTNTALKYIYERSGNELKSVKMTVISKCSYLQNLLTHAKQLEELRVKMMSESTTIDINVPVLHNLKKLHLKFHRDSTIETHQKIIPIFTNISPNITDLTIKFGNDLRRRAAVPKDVECILDSVLALDKIECLTINCNWNENFLRKLKAKNSLKSLNYSGYGLGIHGSVFEDWPSLRTLNLRHNGLGCLGYGVVLNHVQELEFYWRTETASLLEAASFPCLTSMRFNGNQIDYGSHKACFSLIDRSAPNLKYLVAEIYICVQDYNTKHMYTKDLIKFIKGNDNFVNLSQFALKIYGWKKYKVYNVYLNK